MSRALTLQICILLKLQNTGQQRRCRQGGIVVAGGSKQQCITDATSPAPYVCRFVKYTPVNGFPDDCKLNVSAARPNPFSTLLMELARQLSHAGIFWSVWVTISLEDAYNHSDVCDEESTPC